MIQSYGLQQAVTTNAVISFPTNKLRTGIVVTKSEDNNTFYLNRPGIYKVEFNAVGVPTADGDVSAQLTVNGQNIIPALDSMYTGAGETGSIAINTFIPVDRVCACMSGIPVQVIYTGVAGTLNTANIIITKIR